MSELPERLDLRSMDIADDRRQALLEMLPEVRTEDGKIDFDRLRLALGEAVDVGRERYGMTWPGKAECFKTIQAPSLATLRPCPEESVNFDSTENLIIEGDNLEVLKLLQKSYLASVKMIYIDPPYNTGNDFIYPDNFSEGLQTYLEYTGQVDTEGRKFGTNTDTDGRFHSKWLNMMYPRLYLARNLLTVDGIVCVSIDAAEVANARKLLDDIFGEENFVSEITVVSNPRGRQSEAVATTHEYLLAYARDASQARITGQPLSDAQVADYKYTASDGRKYRLRGLRHRGNASFRADRPKMYFPIYVDPASREVSLVRSSRFSVEVLPRKSTGEDGRWEWGPETAAARTHLLEAVLVTGRNEWDIHQREFLETAEGSHRTTKWKSVWDEKEINYQNGGSELKELFGVSPFEYPKPTYLLQKLIDGVAGADDTILDFFAGSGTTGHAVLNLNARDGGRRRFILIQLPEATGREDYATITDITKERLRRVKEKLDSAGTGRLEEVETQDRGFRAYELAESNFRPWTAAGVADAEALAQQLELHVDHTRDGRSQEDVLAELLLKSGFPLTASVRSLRIEGKTVFSVADGALLVCLEQELSVELIRAMAKLQPERVLCLDEGFAGNDQLKTNAVLTFRDAGVTAFKTV